MRSKPVMAAGLATILVVVAACSDQGVRDPSEADQPIPVERPTTAADAQVEAQEAPSVSESYDTDTEISIEGQIVGFVVPPGGTNSFIFLVATDHEGVSERWAIEGNPMDDLLAAGWQLRGTVGPGATVRVTANPQREGVDMFGALDGYPPDLVDRVDEDHIVRGNEIFLDDGRSLVFGAVEE